MKRSRVNQIMEELRAEAKRSGAKYDNRQLHALAIRAFAMEIRTGEMFAWYT